MKICPKCLKQYDDTVELCEDDGQPLKRFRDQTSQMLGQVLDNRWIIEQKIGAGGMGEVYRGRQISVDRTVAIKIMRMALASDEKYAARFFREANLASQIQHPHFVTIHDFGHSGEEQIFYLVMEHLVGQSLSTRMEKGILPLRHILTIIMQMCGALTTAHEKSIIHRDLKPDNIFLVDMPGADEVFVKVLDFGIAKDLEDDEKMTQTGQIFGTPEYMSPEQCQDGTDVDGRSDLYSVGCIMYELVSGFSPFHRDSALQTLLAQVSSKAPSFDDLDLPVPTSVAEVCYRLLEKNPDNRFASARDVYESIEHILDQLEDFEIEAFDESQTRLESAAFKKFPTMQFTDTEPDPLGLETRLQVGVKDAIKSEAAQRMMLESEQSTAEIVEKDDVGRDPRIRPVGPFIVAFVLVAAVAYGGWTFYSHKGPDPAPAIKEAMTVIPNAQLKAKIFADEDGTRGFARRSARLIALKSEALASVMDPERKPENVDKRPRIPTSDLVEVRTSTYIEQFVKRGQKALARCYARRSDRSLAGKYQIAFTIRPNGRTSDIDLGPADFDDKKVDACIQRTIQKWRFPKGKTTDRHERTIVFRTRNN